MLLPEVDVVIPTFNCRSNLTRCLRAIERQTYKGNVRVIIIDGGSTDGTVEVAREFTQDIICNPGQYGTGLNGARHFGSLFGHGSLIWQLDSDNFIEESSALEDLVGAFAEFPCLSVAAPMIRIPSNAGGFNAWLALAEQWFVGRMTLKGEKRGDKYILVRRPDYGLTNAHLITRESYVRSGGYDGDTRMLARLNEAGIATTAFCVTAHYIHEQSDSLASLMRKWSKRANRFQSMTDDQWRAHFISPPPGTYSKGFPLQSMLMSFLLSPYIALAGTIQNMDSRYLMGLAYPLIYAYLALTRAPELVRILAQLREA